MESGFILSVNIPSDRRVDEQAGVTPSPGSAVKDHDGPRWTKIHLFSAEQSGSENMCLVLYATWDREYLQASSQGRPAGDREYQVHNSIYAQ